MLCIRTKTESAGKQQIHLFNRRVHLHKDEARSGRLCGEYKCVRRNLILTYGAQQCAGTTNLYVMKHMSKLHKKSKNTADIYTKSQDSTNNRSFAYC